MSSAYLDTHIAVWLHDGLTRKLTKSAKQEIERNDLLLSPMVYLELDYLFTRGRLRVGAATVCANLQGTFGITLCTLPFSAIVTVAVDFQWTADPFDRLIVANAIANQRAKLISADETIRSNYDQAIW